MKKNYSNFESKNANYVEKILLNDSKKITDITKKSIEETYNINKSKTIEACYSNRYGWTLRKIIS